MGPEIHQKSIKNGVGKTIGKKTGKMRPTWNLGRSIGGLRTAAGEVRRGSPSGYGRIPVKSKLEFRTTPSTPVGYGEFKPLREIAVPQGNPGERAPESHGVSRSSRQNPVLAVPGESCGRKVTAKKVSDNLVRMSVATPLAGGARALAKVLLGLPRLK